MTGKKVVEKNSTQHIILDEEDSILKDLWPLNMKSEVLFFLVLKTFDRKGKLTLFDRKYQDKEYNNTFMAKDFVNVVQTFDEIPSLQTNVRKFKQKLQKRETSLLFGQLLQDIQLIKPTSRSERFSNNSTLFFAPSLENNEVYDNFTHLKKITIYGNQKEKLDEIIDKMNLKGEDFEVEGKILHDCFRGKDLISWISNYLSIPEYYSISLLELYKKHGILQIIIEKEDDIENGFFRIQSKKMTQIFNPIIEKEKTLDSDTPTLSLKKKRRSRSSSFATEKIVIRKTGVIDFNPSSLPNSNHKMKELNVVVCTWNCAENFSPDIGNWIKKQDGDIFIIGFQEIDMSVTSLVKEQSQASLDWDLIFETVFKEEKYQKVVSNQLVGLYHIIFIKNDYSPYLLNLKFSKVSLGQLGMGNKGCIAYRFEFFNNSFCFINAHFAAHQKKIDDRIQNYFDIMNEDLFEESKKLSPFQHDFVFFFGDLNFRIELTYEKTIELIQKKDLKNLILNDQLSLKMKEKSIFQGFYEENITFLPSYKFDKNSNDYDSSEKKRIPSYCDRILIKGEKSKYSISCYKMNSKELNSDHRPILAKFKIYLQ